MTDVLYLSYDGLTDPLGQSQVIPYLQGLTQQGYRFTIVSFEKPERFQTGRNHIQNLLEDSNIRWVPLVYHKSPPVVATLYDVWQMRRTAYELHQENDFQIVHCRSYIPALVGMSMKQKFGVKFIFDMRGFWADERVEGGLWNLNNPVYRFIFTFFKKKEKELLSNADYTISLTHKARSIIHQRKDVQHQPIPIQVIPCCVDTDLFDPAKVDKSDQTAFRERLGIPPDAFVLSYLGSLGTWYMAEEMLRFFTVLQQSQPNAFFLFITQDSPEAIWQLSQRQVVNTNKVVVVSAARSEVPLYLSLSSSSIFFIKPVFSKQASSATKMGEIMSMGIPFVANRGWGDVNEIVSVSEGGFVMNDLTNESFQKATDWLIQNDNRLSHLRTYVVKYFSLGTGVSKYEAVYERVK